jgi:hypothetical protein
MDKRTVRNAELSLEELQEEYRRLVAAARAWTASGEPLSRFPERQRCGELLRAIMRKKRALADRNRNH